MDGRCTVTSILTDEQQKNCNVKRHTTHCFPFSRMCENPHFS